MIIDFARYMFGSLLTELGFLIVSILLRDNKKKMAIVLSVGTIIAGVIGFGPQTLQAVEGASRSLPLVFCFGCTPEKIVVVSGLFTYNGVPLTMTIKGIADKANDNGDRYIKYLIDLNNEIPIGAKATLNAYGGKVTVVYDHKTGTDFFVKIIPNPTIELVEGQTTTITRRLPNGVFGTVYLAERVVNETPKPRDTCNIIAEDLCLVLMDQPISFSSPDQFEPGIFMLQVFDLNEYEK